MITSPFATLLVAIQDRVTQLVPEIKWIDQDLGQLESYGERPAVDWPCLLVDFENFDFEDQGEAIQFASGTILLRLGFPPLSQTNNITPVQWKEKALQYYDIEWKLQKALHSWKPENYGYMLRTNAAIEKREDTIRVRALRYSMTFEDYIAATEFQYIPRPKLDITT